VNDPTASALSSLVKPRRGSVPAHRRKNDLVPRIFITGSADGLGRAAAAILISEGHDVVLHARSRERAAALGDLAPAAAGVVIGDLSSAAETRAISPRHGSPSARTPPQP
jgi:short chain dehydrogenase